MPTYQYRCTTCSHEFEEYQSMKDSPLVTCPNCKKESLQRVIGSGGGMIFKGSGFYQTDYKGGISAKKDSSGEKEPETKKTESSSGKKKSAGTKSDTSSSTDTNKKAAQ